MKLTNALLPADAADILESQVPMVMAIAEAPTPEARAEALAVFRTWVSNASAGLRSADPRGKPPPAAPAPAPSAPATSPAPCQGCEEKAAQRAREQARRANPAAAGAELGGRVGRALRHIMFGEPVG